MHDNQRLVSLHVWALNHQTLFSDFFYFPTNFAEHSQRCSFVQQYTNWVSPSKAKVFSYWSNWIKLAKLENECIDQELNCSRWKDCSLLCFLLHDIALKTGGAENDQKNVIQLRKSFSLKFFCFRKQRLEFVQCQCRKPCALCVARWTVMLCRLPGGWRVVNTSVPSVTKPQLMLLF